MRTLGLTGLMALIAAPVWAGVPAEQAARLGKELTRVGAERAGNAEGSIPAWTGSAAFAPEMLKLTRAELEDLRRRLVQDIQALVGDPAVIGDILVQAQAIMDAFDGPIAAPSANPSQALSPTTAAHVAASLGDKISRSS